MREFGLGVNYFTQGMRLLVAPELRWLVIIPLMLNLALFVGMFYWAAGQYEALVAWMMGWLPDWAAFLRWLLWLVYGLLALTVFAYAFVAMANIIGAPFYGFLSELVEKKLTGQPVEMEGGWKVLLTTVPRALLRELQKIFYYLPRALGVLVLGLIPVMNVAAAILWFLFSSWMMTLQYVDYPADNHRLSFREMRKGISQGRVRAFGFGMPVMVASMIPVLNLVVVPAAVCGATAYWVNTKELHQSGRLKQPSKP